MADALALGHTGAPLPPSACLRKPIQCLQAKALVWQEQVEVLTQALQQANAEKAVLAADKGRLEQEVANLRLQMSVIQKAMESGQLPASAPLVMPSQPQPAPAAPMSPVHPMVQQVQGLSDAWNGRSKRLGWRLSVGDSDLVQLPQ